MKTEKLILNYQRRGIKLSVSDNKLHFSAPQNILTDEDKDILKKNKKEIIKFLLDHTESEIIVDEEDKYEKFPLTDIQLLNIMICCTLLLIKREHKKYYHHIQCHK